MNKQTSVKREACDEAEEMVVAGEEEIVEIETDVGDEEGTEIMHL